MADHETITQPTRPAAGFKTTHESGYGWPEDPPALIVNPSADTAALLRALQSRADLLERDLALWTLVGYDADSSSGYEMACQVYPRVQELQMLIKHLDSRVYAELPKEPAGNQPCLRRVAEGARR